jgi:hypothetical protein
MTLLVILLYGVLCGLLGLYAGYWIFAERGGE